VFSAGVAVALLALVGTASVLDPGGLGGCPSPAMFLIRNWRAGLISPLFVSKRN
jgi:hypothetical protein